MSFTVAMGYDELLAVGDMDKFLTKAKEMCEMKIHTKEFAGMEKDDVVQEVLLTVYKSIDKYDSSRAKANTFFENVIDNRIKDCMKQVSTRANLMVANAAEYVELFNDDSSEDGIENGAAVYTGTEDSEYACTEYMLDFMEHIGLTEKEKQIFKLRCAGYDFMEIATAMNMSKARISQLWKRILKKYEEA